MMLHSGLDSRHLVQMLGEYLGKEQKHWRSKYFRGVSNGVTGEERDEAVSWLIAVNSRFRFSSETCGLAIDLLDRVLQLAKVRAKYLRIVAISCYYIAAKTLEEDEMIPTTLDLVRESQCGYSVSEVLRMEMTILTKLGWNIRTVTAVDFLHIIHAILMWHYPHLLVDLSNMTPSSHLSLLVWKIFTCLSQHQLQAFRPVTIVLALLSLELQQITPSWVSLVLMMEKMAQVNNEELVQCREVLSRLLSKRNQLVTPYKWKVSVQKSKKRKVDDTESDDIYDGIKRLYNEDGLADKPSTLRGSCGSEMHLDTDEVYPQVSTVCAN